VHADLIVIRNETEGVGSYMAFAVEILEAAPDVNVLTFGGQGLCAFWVGIAVYPLLYVN